MKKIVLFLSALLAFCATAVAEVTLPSLMGDGMVLQRNSQVNLWGSATGSTVKVETSWDGRKYSVKSDSDGSWRVQVSTPDAGGPYRITFNDGQKIVLDNVLIGEVWICSGQSNMEMPVGGWDHQRVNGSAETIRAATSTPLVRMFTVKRNNADEPQETCEGEWKTSTPAAVRYFSAAAYYFGKTLSEYLPDVPIGLIATDWGGTPIEAWMSTGALEATPGINLQLAKSHRWYEVRTGQLFNGMIYPLRKYKARGFIWYQGEANLNAAVDYPALTVSMVNEWRELWGDPDMPYYLVQIAPHAYGNPAADALPRFVEQQYRIPSLLPHSAVAPTTDIGHCDCIHPPFKQEVGERLAWLALARDYGISDLPVAPEYKGMKIEGSAVRLSFKRGGGAGDGLMCFGPQRKLELKGFEVAGADRVWHDAVAEIERKTNDILVSSPEVPHPAAVRYAFRNWPEDANVTTDNGLPLPMFRTDLFNRADTLRLLAIGNSFSEDAVENNLWELLDAAGIPAVVANMFIGGCSLERHAQNLKLAEADPKKGGRGEGTAPQPD